MLDSWMIEMTYNSRWGIAEKCHESARLLRQRYHAGLAIKGSQLGIAVPVQAFVRIDFRRVWQEIEDLDPLFGFSEQSCHKSSKIVS